MKATLKFNLDDPDDAVSHLRCVKSLSMALALCDFRSAGMSVRKMDVRDEDRFNILCDKIDEAIVKYNIDLEELIL